MLHDYAVLSNDAEYTVFEFNDDVIRFAAPLSLERYTEVVEWNHGYLVVMAKYKNKEEVEEEYIDLIPILRNLYYDVEEFLEPIKEVRINYKDDIKRIIDNADFITYGYAFTRDHECVRVFDLKSENSAAVILNDRIIETNMEECGRELVLNGYMKNKHLLWEAKENCVNSE